MNIPNILKIIRVHIVVGGFLAFLLGVLFGLIPSYQASQLKPVDALKG